MERLSTIAAMTTPEQHQTPASTPAAQPPAAVPPARRSSTGGLLLQILGWGLIALGTLILLARLGIAIMLTSQGQADAGHAFGYALGGGITALIMFGIPGLIALFVGRSMNRKAREGR